MILIDLKSPEESLRFVREIFVQRFPGHPAQFLATVFEKLRDLFAGRYPGYQACDTAFHDLNHTCQAAVATARILDGHIRSGQSPALSARDFELAMAGIWLHDIGFLKATGDDEGTGAKYTLTHVRRSADFAGSCLPRLGVTDDEVRIVQVAIHCTGLNADTSHLSFPHERARLIGYALGSGDMLGQMAAANYPERLPNLYSEFVEGGITTYVSAEDLLSRTREFYEHQVRGMLEEQWGGVHRALQHHFPDGRNHYFEAIEANLDRIDRVLVDNHDSRRGGGHRANV